MYMYITLNINNYYGYLPTYIYDRTQEIFIEKKQYFAVRLIWYIALCNTLKGVLALKKTNQKINMNIATIMASFRLTDI